MRNERSLRPDGRVLYLTGRNGSSRQPQPSTLVALRLPESSISTVWLTPTNPTMAAAHTSTPSIRRRVPIKRDRPAVSPGQARPYRQVDSLFIDPTKPIGTQGHQSQGAEV